MTHFEKALKDIGSAIELNCLKSPNYHEQAIDCLEIAYQLSITNEIRLLLDDAKKGFTPKTPYEILDIAEDASPLWIQ